MFRGVIATIIVAALAEPALVEGAELQYRGPPEDRDEDRDHQPRKSDSRYDDDDHDDRDRKHRRKRDRRSIFIPRIEHVWINAPEEVAVRPQPPYPPPFARPEPEAKPEPLDPHGSHRVRAAPGAEAAGVAWAVGEPLPDSLPHVTLDPLAFGLPEPPAGQIYARVRREVLLIEAAGRVVVAEVEPPTQ